MDGAGEIVATGQNSIWKIGDRVVITPTGWDSEEAEGVPSLEASRGKGAGSVEGVLRQFAVLVSPASLVCRDSCFEREECKIRLCA